MKWKVTRESEDSYKGDKGTEKLEALVAALRAYMVWEPATVVEADYRTVMYRAAEAAIKEATT